MPLTTFIGVADANERIPTELIDEFVMSYEYALPIGLAIAWAQPGRGNVPVSFARWGQVTVAGGTVAETVDAPENEVVMAENNITPGMVRYTFKISDEMQAGAEPGVPASAVQEGIRALVNRMDVDSLSISTSASNTSGAATDTLTLSNFRAGVAAYKALNIPPSALGHAAVLSHESAADLADALHSSGATLPMSPQDSVMWGPVSGALGRYHGFMLFESGNVAVEGAGHSNFLTPIGRRASGLGVVVNHLPKVTHTRGDDAESRASDYWHFSAWYGTGLTNPNRILELLAS